MKIFPQNSLIGFEGYDARKLKGLYMQSAEAEPQQFMFKDISIAAQDEGFDIFISSKDKLISSPKDLPEAHDGKYDYWGQDNKMFIDTKDGVKIIYPKIFYTGSNDEAKKLGKLTNVPLQESELIIEGGNIFIGKKDNGDNYLIIGKDTLSSSAVFQFLKEKNVQNLDDKKLRKFLNCGSVFKSTPIFSDVVHVSEYMRDKEYWEDFTTDIFCNEFDVKKENFHILSQPNYHLDLAIKPLEYPFVLVNDDEMMKKNLKEFEEKFDCSDKLLKNLKKHQKFVERNYANSSVIKKQLEAQGFVPIMVSGAIGNHKVNFLNSIVNKRNDGISYITNSVECKDKRFEFFQDKFEKDIMQKYPAIDRFYYVDGAMCEDGQNLAMKYLSEFRGGIHCLCAEEPDFTV